MGSMVTGSKDIDNVRYFFNTLGEKTLLLQNKDRIVYAFADGDIDLVVELLDGISLPM